MKTDLKTEVKQENFGEFEAREQVGIDLITNKYTWRCCPDTT